MMWRHTPETYKGSQFDLDTHFPKTKETIQSLFNKSYGYNRSNPYDSNNCPVVVKRLEPVQNHKLLIKFEEFRKGNPNLRLELGFHGTSSFNHRSIKRRGLVVPSTLLQIANGNAYGKGVYISKCPVYSMSYVRTEKKMFVCAVLVGDGNVTVNGNILVAHQAHYCIPCYVMEYEGPAPSYDYRANNVFNHPVAHYLSWWICALGIFLLSSLACLVVTTIILTLSWLVGFGHLTGMSYTTFLTTGGTSNIMYAISYPQTFSYVVWRGIMYCLVWKGLKGVCYNALVPAFGLFYRCISWLPLGYITTPISYLFTAVSIPFKTAYWVIRNPLASLYSLMGWKALGVLAIVCFLLGLYRLTKRSCPRLPIPSKYGSYGKSKSLSWTHFGNNRKSI